MRTFYRTVIEVEVLSEEPFEWDHLDDVAFAIKAGACSGRVKEASAKRVNGAQMAKLLQAQGSDPSFFRLTAKGGEVE